MAEIASESDTNGIINDATNQVSTQQPPIGSSRKRSPGFPEGEPYAWLLMEIVDKCAAHIPPRGKIGACWQSVVAGFDKATGPTVEKFRDWRPLQKKYMFLRDNCKAIRQQVEAGVMKEEDLSDLSVKIYNMSHDHTLECADAEAKEIAAKKRMEEDASNQVAQGRALCMKVATRIRDGEVVEVGGPKMLLGDDGKVVTIDSDDESAIAQVMSTPATKRIRRTKNSSDRDGYGGSSNSRPSMCRELINSITNSRQGNVEVELQRLEFEKEQAQEAKAMEMQRFDIHRMSAEQKYELEKRYMECNREDCARRFELEREDRAPHHEMGLQTIQLQKLQLKLQLAAMKAKTAPGVASDSDSDSD